MKKMIGIVICFLCCFGCAQRKPEETISLYATFDNTSAECLDEYRPSVTFNTDHSFVFRENLYAGMGELLGDFVEEENRLILTVTSHTLYGFRGDDTETIVFLLQPDGSLQIDTDICLTKKGDCFQQAKD